MRYFRVRFEWYTRPRFRVGRLKTCEATFAAGNIADAYRLAQEDGKKRFPRHRWRVVVCNELTVGGRE